MNYKLPNGKVKRIPDDELKHYMASMGLTQDEAIQMYLEDEGILINEEQEALDQKAKDARITATIHQAREYKPKTQRERVMKPDPTKEGIIAAIAETLQEIADSVEIVNKTKLITFTIGKDQYKIDLTRKNLALAERKAAKK